MKNNGYELDGLKTKNTVGTPVIFNTNPSTPVAVDSDGADF